MCGRFTLFSSAKTLSKELDMALENIGHSHNISPGDSVLSIHEDSEGKSRIADYAQWGLKTPQNFHINARIETIDTLPRFRDAWAQSRCLIPANGFYEWYRDGVTKQPYYIFPKNHTPIYLGALRYSLPNESDNIVLITTESNADIQAVHDRMPLMIPIQAHKEWLKGTINKSRLIEMNSAISMEAHTVSRRVNSTLNNDPKLIDRKDPANDDQLRLF
jgi:putative SOS response-associated peptidase YedK